MEVRAYQSRDWNSLCAIHNLARMDELRRANLVDAFLPLEISAEREGLFEYQVLVAETAGIVPGFVAFGDEELAWLYVRPDFYRKGVARLLTRAVIDARPAKLTTEVLQGNDAAVRFYQSMGFVESGLSHGRMPGNEEFFVTVHSLVRAATPDN